MDIFNDFRKAANPENAVPMSAYMRDQFPYLGIKTPDRKKLSRDFLKKQKDMDWSFVLQCWEQPEREFQYLAVDYLVKLKSALTPDDIPNLRTLIITKSWWDTIDGIDRIVGDIALRYPEVNNTLIEWSLDNNIWIRRIAIDHQLMRKNKTDTALLEKIIVNNFGQKEFSSTKPLVGACASTARPTLSGYEVL